jgi:hypothetical protein
MTNRRENAIGLRGAFFIIVVLGIHLALITTLMVERGNAAAWDTAAVLLYLIGLQSAMRRWVSRIVTILVALFLVWDAHRFGWGIKPPIILAYVELIVALMAGIAMGFYARFREPARTSGTEVHRERSYAVIVIISFAIGMLGSVWTLAGVLVLLIGFQAVWRHWRSAVWLTMAIVTSLILALKLILAPFIGTHIAPPGMQEYILLAAALIIGAATGFYALRSGASA